MLVGALIGGLIGVLVLMYTFYLKDQRFKKIISSLNDPSIEYSASFNYASAKRYRNSFKFYDSYGALYLIGNTVYYKFGLKDAPYVFNLRECTVQQEADWRKLKWFSITKPGGEKYYFNSNKMGGVVNNSDETMRALAAIQAKKSS